MASSHSEDLASRSHSHCSSIEGVQTRLPVGKSSSVPDRSPRPTPFSATIAPLATRPTSASLLRTALRATPMTKSFFLNLRLRSMQAWALASAVTPNTSRHQRPRRPWTMTYLLRSHNPVQATTRRSSSSQYGLMLARCRHHTRGSRRANLLLIARPVTPTRTRTAHSSEPAAHPATPH